MNCNKLHFNIVFILLVVACFAGCVLLLGCQSGSQNESSASENSEAFDVTDLTNRAAHFDKPAERVVALAASDAEILYAIDADDTLVGRGTYCDYPAAVTDVTDVGSGELTSIEAIIALRPDAVFMSKMGQTTAQVNALENAGLKVIVNDASTIDQVYDYINVLGTVVGKQENAERVVAEMQAKFADVSQKMSAKFSSNSDAEGQNSVYFEVSPLQYGLWTAGSNTFMQEIADVLCMKNVFSDCDGWAEVSAEQVIARNPSNIVAVTMYDGEGQRPEDEICGRSGWGNITAVENGSVYNVDSNIITRPGPRLADAAVEICNKILGA